MCFIVMIISSLISSIMVNLYYHRHRRLGTLIIDSSDPENEKWRLVIQDGVIEDRHKRVVLDIDRNTRL